MGRAAWGVRPPARLQEGEVDDRPSRLGAPLLPQHELQPLTRHLQVRGGAAAHTPAARLAATLGSGTDRRAACRGAIERAVWSGATERGTSHGASERAATAALAGGRRAEAVGRAKPGLSSRSTLTVLDRGTAAAGPEGAGARRSAAAEAIDEARGL